MVYDSEIEMLSSGTIQRLRPQRNGVAIGHREAISLLAESQAFRDFFNSLLRDAPFDAYLWETPALHQHCSDQAFEFVLVDNRTLARVEADPAPFQSQFAQAPTSQTVMVFDNLGGDARLVAPCATPRSKDFAHLAAFARKAPRSLQQTFWRQVGNEVKARICDVPLWLNTNGLGVYWLHVRLDSRPKYYTYQPYKSL